MKQGSCWTDHANQVVWGWVERYHVGIGGWGENMRVRVEDRKEAWELVPERMCKMNRSAFQKEGYPSLTTYTCSVCGMGYLSIEAPERGDYCKGCGAKVVDE